MDASLRNKLAWSCRWRFVVAGTCSIRTGVRVSRACSARALAYVQQSHRPLPPSAGRPPAGAREGEKVKDYPQLSIRVPVEMNMRLAALSAVTGIAQWRIIVDAIDCYHNDLPPTDRHLVDGLSERLLKAAS